MFPSLWFRRATGTPHSPGGGGRRHRPRLHLEPLEDRALLSGDVVLHWNAIALQATTNAPPSQVPVFRNLAIIQVAVFDAVDAIDRSYTPYGAAIGASRGASI